MPQALAMMELLGGFGSPYDVCPKIAFDGWAIKNDRGMCRGRKETICLNIG